MRAVEEKAEEGERDSRRSISAEAPHCIKEHRANTTEQPSHEEGLGESQLGAGQAKTTESQRTSAQLIGSKLLYPIV